MQMAVTSLCLIFSPTQLISLLNRQCSTVYEPFSSSEKLILVVWLVKLFRLHGKTHLNVLIVKGTWFVVAIYVTIVTFVNIA